MNQHLTDVPQSGETGLRKARWSLIPALTAAGLVSAIVSGVLWFPSIVLLHSSIAFESLAGLSFGLAVGAVLWFCGLIRNAKTLGAVLGATVTAHLMGLGAELYLPVNMREYGQISGLGSVEPLVLITSFLVAFILYAAVLMLTTPRCAIGWTASIALVCSALASATIAMVDGTHRGVWINVWNGHSLGLVWQLALAFFLGIALVAKNAGFQSRRPLSHERSRYNVSAHIPARKK